MSAAPLMSVFGFMAVLLAVPAGLWLLRRQSAGGGLRRTGLGGGRGAGRAGTGMKVIESLALGPGQRLVTVELGEGAQRRWLVLGVTAQNITPLRSIEPPPVSPVAVGACGPTGGAPFSALLARFRAPAPQSPSAGARDVR